jgi:hypothetical protein
MQGFFCGTTANGLEVGLFSPRVLECRVSIVPIIVTLPLIHAVAEKP